MRRVWRSTLCMAVAVSVWPLVTPAQIGTEKAIPRHLRDGEEFEITIENCRRVARNRPSWGPAGISAEIYSRAYRAQD